jgi:putative transposase
MSSTQKSANANPQKRNYTYRSVEDWRRLIKLYDESDLSQTEFCKQHSIASSGLYKWRSRFADECPSPSPAFINITDNIQRVTPPATEVTHHSTAWDVELDLGHGRILRLRTT